MLKASLFFVQTRFQFDTNFNLNSCDTNSGCTCLGFLEQCNKNTSYCLYDTLSKDVKKNCSKRSHFCC